MNAYLRCALLLLAFGATATLAATQTRTSAFEYDTGSGLLVKEIIEPDNSALCLVTTYTYDGYGNKTVATTRNCNGDSSEAPLPTGDPLFTSRSSSSAFAAGSVLIGGTTYAWRAGQFATTSTNALNKFETKTYDPRFGMLVGLTGPNDLTTSWSYDSFGRKSSESRADGTTTTWAYTRCADSPGTCPTYGVYFVTVTSTGAPQSRAFYDSLNRELRTETQGFDGTWVRKDVQYDARGRVAQISRPYKATDAAVWTVFQYDDLNRVVQADEPSVGGKVLRTVTAYNGLTTSVTASNAGTGTSMPGGVVQTKSTRKNSQGQVATVTDTQNNTITYGYDPFGNLLTTNAAGVLTSLGYDQRGRKSFMTDPDMGSWLYYYNALGELIRQTDAKAQSVTMAYDVLGRMTSRTEPDLVSTWTYDSCTKGVGKLCSVSSTNGYSRTHSYDALGRPSSLSVSIDVAYGISTTYDTSGRVDTVTYPTGYTVRNIYNAYGYLWKVQRTNDPDPTIYWTANSENAAGQVTSELLGNGLTTTRTYDALFRMSAVTSSNVGGTVHNLAYTYDTVGNVTQRQDITQSVTENFAFDTLNRLLSASGTGLTTRSFNYNAIGNMTYKSDVGTYTYPLPSAVRPHAVSSVSGSGAANSVTASYGYDANGNLTSASGTIYPASGSVAFSRSLAPTSYNMPATLTHIQGGSTYSYTYTYNAEHERVKLVTQRPDGSFTSIYVHPNGKGALLYEKEIRASDGRIEHKHYVNGGAGLVGVFVTKSSYGTGEGPEMRYFHRDHLGSVAVITNPAGAVVERLAYEAYGERRYPSGAAENRSSPLIGVSTDRGFTAHEHLDEMMLIHMNGRIYDPIVARFVAADPYIDQTTNLQSYNRYSYVYNNPIGYVDPTGYSSCGFCDDVGDAIEGLGGSLSNAWKSVWRSELGQAYIQIGVFAAASGTCGAPINPGGFYCGAAAVGAYNAAYTKYEGGDWDDAARNGLIAGGTAAALVWAQGSIPLSAGIGCAGAAAGDGDCGAGAVSAGGGAAAGAALKNPQLAPFIPSDPIARVVIVATLGGTVSSLAGGKFGNGAATAAFAYLLSPSTVSEATSDKTSQAGAPDQIQGKTPDQTQSKKDDSVVPVKDPLNVTEADRKACYAQCASQAQQWCWIAMVGCGTFVAATIKDFRGIAIVCASLSAGCFFYAVPTICNGSDRCGAPIPYSGPPGPLNRWWGEQR